MSNPELESRARTDDLLDTAAKLRDVARTIEEEGERVRVANDVAHGLNPWSRMAAAGTAICADMHTSVGQTVAEIRRQADYLEKAAGLYTDAATQARIDVSLA